MKSEGLAFFSDTHWTLVGLLIFFISFFVLMVVQQKVYKKDDVEFLEKLPLEGDPS